MKVSQLLNENYEGTASVVSKAIKDFIIENQCRLYRGLKGHFGDTQIVDHDGNTHFAKSSVALIVPEDVIESIEPLKNAQDKLGENRTLILQLGILNTPVDRKPKDTPVKVHGYADEAFFAEFNKKFRSNAVFVIKEVWNATTYGQPGIVAPIGQSKALWSDTIKDLFADVLKISVRLRPSMEFDLSSTDESSATIWTRKWITSIVYSGVLKDEKFSYITPEMICAKPSGEPPESGLSDVLDATAYRPESYVIDGLAAIYSNNYLSKHKDASAEEIEEVRETCVDDLKRIGELLREYGPNGGKHNEDVFNFMFEHYVKPLYHVDDVGKCPSSNEIMMWCKEYCFMTFAVVDKEEKRFISLTKHETEKILRQLSIEQVLELAVKMKNFRNVNSENLHLEFPDTKQQDTKQE